MNITKNNKKNEKLERTIDVGISRPPPDHILRARNSYYKQRRLCLGSGLIGLLLIIGGSISIGTGIGIYLLIISPIMLVFATAMGIAAYSNNNLLKLNHYDIRKPSDVWDL